jgi:hypothetical protein
MTSTDVHRIAPDVVDEQTPAMPSLVSPWHAWLDRVA